MAWDKQNDEIVRLHGGLGDLESDADSLVAVLDQLTTGALIVSEALQVICLNRKAEALLGKTDVLQVHSGTLVLQDPSRLTPLLEAIRTALAEKSREDSQTSPQLVSLPREHHPPLSLFALPIRQRDQPRLGADTPARVMLMLYDPEARPQVNASLLEIIFGLTSTEASIAAAIAQGQSLSEIADLRSCLDSTIRTHLKSIFRKTHTHRQSDLVCLILTSVAVSYEG